jgi:AraC-like DNA-binding protein
MTSNEQDHPHSKLPVPAAFKDIISHFYFAENKGDKPLAKTLLPNFQTILIFSFGKAASLISQQGTSITIEKCLVVGPIKQAFDYTLSPGAEILVVNFKDDAFYRFFGNAVHLPVNPDELLADNCFTGVWFALQKMDTAAERANFILEFCKPYLRNRNTTAGLLTQLKDDALNPIKVVAEQTQQTERNVQLHHKKYFGYSAKEINRYQRFIKAVEIIQRMATTGTKADWFEVIDQCGYYDQSQLIHDFRHFVNLSPTKFLQFQQDICQGKPG